MARRAPLIDSLRHVVPALCAVAGVAACGVVPDSLPGARTPPLDAPPVQGCTLIGCESGLAVRFEPTQGWPRGEYLFEIDVDGVQATCRASLPLPACPDRGAPWPASPVSCEPADLLTVGGGTCASSPEHNGFSSLRLAAELRPGRVTITVIRNGDVVASARLAPEFLRLQPNGPACPPTCDVAEATVPVELP